MLDRIKTVSKMLGPGLLSAGAAIGVSHLVQSTKAGAEFGFSLFWVVIVSNLIKYPFFEMAPRYTAATGKNVLHGYAEIGRWPLFLVGIMTIGTMFTIQAAVTIVTAGLAIEIFGLPLDAKVTSLVLLLICGSLLAFGKYSILDRLIKVIIVLLSLTTIASLLGAIGTERVLQATNPFNWDERAHLFFLVGLAGWMPAPLDLSVWHSIWMEEKSKLEKKTISLREALIDFNVGYVGTAILAMCFLALGALVLHGSGEKFSGSAAVFAGQLIKLYTSSLGGWAYILIAAAAFTTMFSTTLTCFDAFPRVLRSVGEILFGKKDGSRRMYIFWLSIVFLGSLILLFMFIKNMGQMVSIATTLSFVLAPFYAVLNFVLVRRPEVPVSARIGPVHNAISVACLFLLLSFSLWFIWLKYLS